MTVEVTIYYDDPQFFAALNDPEGFMPFLEEAMGDILQRYGEVASTYAPESDANKPGRTRPNGEPMGYYERGRGWWSPLVTHGQIATAGEIPTVRPHLLAPKTLGAGLLSASGFAQVKGYTLRPVSEQMHDRWGKAVARGQDQVVGTLFNVASYSGLVQGEEQTALHEERGWVKAEDMFWADEVQRYIDDRTEQAVQEYYNA